jgi:hypothetical protein
VWLQRINPLQCVKMWGLWNLAAGRDSKGQSSKSAARDTVRAREQLRGGTQPWQVLEIHRNRLT